jgi:hypothetical protein
MTTAVCLVLEQSGHFLNLFRTDRLIFHPAVSQISAFGNDAFGDAINQYQIRL